MAGVFITKGMRVGIKEGDFKISVDENGKFKPSITLSVHFDVLPTWIKLTFENLAECQEWYHKRQEAWNGKTEEAKASTLEKEFETSMQTIIAMAIAFDSFYGNIKDLVPIDSEITKKWKQNRTARHTQISEVIRRGFKLDNKATKSLTQALSRIFKLRDMAIHPKGTIEQAILHPELNVGVEWRFVYFSYLNAKATATEGLKIFKYLFGQKNLINKELRTYCATVMSELSQLNLNVE